MYSFLYNRVLNLVNPIQRKVNTGFSFQSQVSSRPNVWFIKIVGGFKREMISRDLVVFTNAKVPYKTGFSKPSLKLLAKWEVAIAWDLL